MVQVLPNMQRKSSGEKFGQAFSNLGQSLGQSFAEKMANDQRQKQMQEEIEQENKQIYEATGFDLSGIKDPKQRQEAFKQALQEKYGKNEQARKLEGEAENQRKLEMLKQEGKKSLLTEKQNYLDKLLSPKQNNPSGIINKEEGAFLEEHGIEPENISDEDIIRATAMDPNLGRVLQSQKDAAVKKLESSKKEKRTQFVTDREYHSKTSQPIIDAAQAIVKEYPIEKGLVDQQRRDIESGNTEGIIPFLVEKTGIEAYRNPESSRFKTISKQRFVESLHSLGSAGARPNQFIEQQLVGAQATLGRDKESNLTTLDLEDFVKDLKYERAKIELELAEEDRENHGFAKNDIALRADKKMKDYAEQRQDEMAYDIRKRHEENMSNEELTREIVGKHVTPDTPLTIRAARILMLKNNDDEKKAQAEAKKLGYKIPNEATYLRG